MMSLICCCNSIHIGEVAGVSNHRSVFCPILEKVCIHREAFDFELLKCQKKYVDLFILSSLKCLSVQSFTWILISSFFYLGINHSLVHRIFSTHLFIFPGLSGGKGCK